MNLKRIGIDASSLADVHRTGVGRYLANLLPRLVSLGEHRVQFFCYAGRQFCSEIISQLSDQNKIVTRSVNFHSLILWQRFGMGLWTYRDNIDLFFSPEGNLPLFLKSRSISVFQDLIWRSYPGVGLHIKAINMMRHRSSFERADLVIAPSNFTRRELQKYNNNDTHTIEVVPLGVDQEVFLPLNTVTHEITQTTLRRYSIEPGYFLTIGNLLPHKNLWVVIKAIEHLYHSAGAAPQLVVVGAGKTAHLEKTFPAPLRERVRFLGFVDDKDLPSIYRGARALIFPSLCEGFGLPVLEAMACGIPVVHSNSSSVSEVAGDAGLSFNPGDVGGLASILLQLLSDSELTLDLRNRGSMRVTRFSWEKTAGRVWELIESTLKRQSSNQR